MKYFLIAILLFTLGCTPLPPLPPLPKNICLGKFISVELLETNWNESIKSKITTDQGQFIYYGIISGFYGEKICVREDRLGI